MNAGKYAYVIVYEIGEDGDAYGIAVLPVEECTLSIGGAYAKVEWERASHRELHAAALKKDRTKNDAKLPPVKYATFKIDPDLQIPIKGSVPLTMSQDLAQSSSEFGAVTALEYPCAVFLAQAIAASLNKDGKLTQEPLTL